MYLKISAVCLAFMCGAGLVQASKRSDPARAMPTVCKATPEWVDGKLDTSRCWDGTHHIYLMAGYRAMELEGGPYLVGWPK